MAGTVPKGNIDGAERRYRAQGQTVLNRNSRRAEAGNYSLGRHIDLDGPNMREYFAVRREP